MVYRVYRSGPVIVRDCFVPLVPTTLPSLWDGSEIKKKKNGKKRFTDYRLYNAHNDVAQSWSLCTRTFPVKILSDTLVSYNFLTKAAVETFLRFSPLAVFVIGLSPRVQRSPHVWPTHPTARTPTVAADTRACTYFRFRPHTDTDAVRAFPIVWY